MAPVRDGSSHGAGSGTGRGVGRWLLVLVALAMTAALLPATLVAGERGATTDVPSDVAQQTDEGATSDEAQRGRSGDAPGQERASERRPEDVGPPPHAGRPGEGDDGDPDEPTTAGPPTDYIAMAERGELSPEVYGDDDIVTIVEQVELHDGELMHVQITMPREELAADGGFEEGFPVILKASPYEGTLLNRTGWRIFPDPKNGDGELAGLVGYFPRHGYAVAIADLRGTGRSTGCLDHLGPNDAKDMTTVVEWLASRDWSNGNVGMLGHSYVGSTPSLAAAQAPEGLRTIIPSAGLASMYDHQFQSGVKYFLQWSGTMWTYAFLTVSRDLPVEVDTMALGETGDNFPNERPEQTGCGYTTSSLTAGHGQATGQYQAWHAQRDWRQGATDADIPIFMVHGVNDNAARIPAAEWFYGQRFGREGDKVWLSQHDHGSANVTTCEHAEADVGHPNCRMDQWKYAVHAWFDKHLMERDVDTGNPVEVFLNGDKVHTATAWDEPDEWVTIYPDADGMTLGFDVPEDAASESWTAHGRTQFSPDRGYHGEGSSLEFVSEPLTDDLTSVGPPPRLRLDTSVTTSQSLNVIGILYREDEAGERTPMNHCAIDPQFRWGLATPAAIVPGEVMPLELQCFTVAHHVEAGERLVLSIQTWSDHHVGDTATDLQVTIHTGPEASRYALPVVPDPVLHDDIRVFEDQQPG